MKVNKFLWKFLSNYQSIFNRHTDALSLKQSYAKKQTIPITLLFVPQKKPIFFVKRPSFVSNSFCPLLSPTFRGKNGSQLSVKVLSVEIPVTEKMCRFSVFVSYSELKQLLTLKVLTCLKEHLCFTTSYYFTWRFSYISYQFSQNHKFVIK